MRPKRRSFLVTILIAAAAVTPPAVAAAEPPTRYSLVGGCWTAEGAPGAERVRLQATTLGRYLMLRTDGRYVAEADGRLSTAAEASPAADLEVTEAGDGTFTLTPQSTGAPIAAVRFSEAEGCATFPEAPTNTTGTPSRGELSYGEVGGFVEAHMHWMTYEKYGRRFQCGRPWHPYGITRALPDCAEVEGPQGSAAPLQNTFNYGSPVAPHDTSGYPKLTSWGRKNLTYEGTYWRWVERAHRAGLRLMVMAINDNRVLCEAQAVRETDCNEMNTVRRGLLAMRELQDYVDAQAGGPGRGWFQIVTDPFEARRVINAGRMAVVLEIETSELFDCRGWDQPSCDRAQVDRGLDEVHALGVRSLMLLNKFDNPLTGVRMDSGTNGYLTNAGNRLSAGSFFAARTCTGPLTDNTLDVASAPGNNETDAALGTLGVPRGTLPTYPKGPHCNVRGLTDLGRHVVRRMMDLGMIVNPDHMSQAAVDETLSLLEARRYSGVISPHGWVDPGNWPRIWNLGGMAFPGHSDADRYVADWRRLRPEATPFLLGWGYGADLGGLSTQPGPSKDGAISYPFKSFDGQVTVDRQTTGERTFDYTKEGVAHYGLYADWWEDLRRLGGEKMREDLWRGAEAYLQLWERASGVTVRPCMPERREFTRQGLGPLELGAGHVSLLRRGGQPQQRDRAWSWCVKGEGNETAADVAVLSREGEVELVGSTARGRETAGLSVGDRAPRGAESLRVRRTGDRAYVAAIADGRVRAVAVAVARLAGDRDALRAAVDRLLTAEAAAAPRRFVPGPDHTGIALPFEAHDHGSHVH